MDSSAYMKEKFWVHHSTIGNKNILVNGSGRGIGRGIELHSANLGAQVVNNFFRNRKPAEQTAADIRELG